MSEGQTLPLEFGRMLGLAVLAVMQRLGADVMELDEDAAPGIVRLARVGERLVIVEREGCRGTGMPHRYTAYWVAEVAPGEPFKLAPEAMLFILHERGFYAPPDWHLELIENPHDWFNAVMAAINVALEPVAPRVN